jgi:NhaP-type Na+/H+ or K+/H+ antiporter
MNFHLVMKSSKGRKTGGEVKFAKNADQIRRISLLAGVCTVCLLILCIIFLYAAATGNTIPVLVFVFLEILPSAGFLFYLRPFGIFNLLQRHLDTSSHSHSRSRTTTNRLSRHSLRGTVASSHRDSSTN